MTVFMYPNSSAGTAQITVIYYNTILSTGLKWDIIFENLVAFMAETRYNEA